MYPIARTTDLTIEALPSETVVYDTTNHRVHCLNEMAGLIWRHCDANSSVEQIAGRLSLGSEASSRLGCRQTRFARIEQTASARAGS